MRQVVPVWPACWGYSCSGPTTYFGPSQFNSSTSISFDLQLEDHGTLTVQAGTKMSIGADGSWSIDKQKGSGLDFKQGQWGTFRFDQGPGYVAGFLNGKMFGNSTTKVGSGYNIKVSLDRYIFASIDNFAITAM